MSYLDKKYISTTGHDFTEFVNTEEDAKIFDEMVEHERQCIGIPASQCITHVVDALNLGRKLQGIKHKVILMGNPNLN